MKNSPLTTILLAALLVTSLSTVWVCWRYVSKSRELRALQGQVNDIKAYDARVSALASEAVEYGKTHPAIEPLLDQYIKQPGRTNTPPANIPSKPTATK
jgi:hypothetical protein